MKLTNSLDRSARIAIPVVVALSLVFSGLYFCGALIVPWSVHVWPPALLGAVVFAFGGLIAILTAQFVHSGRGIIQFALALVSMITGVAVSIMLIERDARNVANRTSLPKLSARPTSAVRKRPVRQTVSPPTKPALRESTPGRPRRIRPSAPEPRSFPTERKRMRLCLDAAKKHWLVDRADYARSEGLGWVTYTGPNPAFFDFNRLRYIGSPPNVDFAGDPVGTIWAAVHAPVHRSVSGPDNRPWEAGIECKFNMRRNAITLRTLERTDHANRAPRYPKSSFGYLENGLHGYRLQSDGRIRRNSGGYKQMRVVTATFELDTH